MRRNPLSCRSVLQAWLQLLLGPLGPGDVRPMEHWGRLWLSAVSGAIFELRQAGMKAIAVTVPGLILRFGNMFGTSRSRAKSMTWVQVAPLAKRMTISLRRRSISQDKMPSGRPGRSLSPACSHQRTPEEASKGECPMHVFLLTRFSSDLSLLPGPPV